MKIKTKSMIKVENNPSFKEDKPMVKDTFTVKEVNDLVSTIAQYIKGNLDVDTWCDKMLEHCGNNSTMFRHCTIVVQDALINRLKESLRTYLNSYYL